MSEKNFETDGFVEQKGSDLWLPENEGELLEGLVIDIVEGMYGTQLIIEDKYKKMIRTPSHKVLQLRLAVIKRGDQIRLVYEGEEAATKKGNNPTKLYRVYKK